MTEPVDHVLLINYDPFPVDPGEVFGIRVYQNVSETDVSEEDLEKGRAFFLDKYEHGLVSWQLEGEGMQCRWDTAKCAGVLVFEDWRYEKEGQDYDRLQSVAREFLRDYYTPYVNGEVYFVRLDDHSGIEVYPINFEEQLEELLRGLPNGNRVAVFGNALSQWLQSDIEDVLSKLGLKPVWGPCCPHCRKPMAQHTTWG